MTSVAPTQESQVRRNRPSSVHHFAWQVTDQETNRQFFEDMIGLPLIASFSDESDVEPGLKFCHTLYELGDGNSLSFFQLLGDSAQVNTSAFDRFNHIALRADAATQQEVHERLLAANYEHTIQDHGWTVSLYVRSPDGICIELAVDTERAKDVFRRRRIDPHGELRKWMSGDHTPNSDDTNNPEPVKRYPAS